MRDLSRDNRFLSINTATLRRERPLGEVVAALAKAGIPGIGPWREQIQAIGTKAAAKLIGDHGLVVSGVSRAGVFTAKGRAGLQEVLDDNRRAVADRSRSRGAAHDPGIARPRRRRVTRTPARCRHGWPGKVGSPRRHGGHGEAELRRSRSP